MHMCKEEELMFMERVPGMLEILGGMLEVLEMLLEVLVMLLQILQRLLGIQEVLHGLLEMFRGLMEMLKKLHEELLQILEIHRFLNVITAMEGVIMPMLVQNKRQYPEHLEPINETYEDDQIDSNIIFNDHDIEVNSGENV
ncbi:hypothetical protein Tco_0456373 [Tanacetum coccineum]